MYAVIFRAVLSNPDAEYFETASRLREIAMKEYGCTEFTACTEGEEEIAISYWPSKEHIQAWKKHPSHQKAQRLGKSKWYRSYQVQIVEVLSQYASHG